MFFDLSSIICADKLFKDFDTDILNLFKFTSLIFSISYFLFNLAFNFFIISFYPLFLKQIDLSLLYLLLCMAQQASDF